MSDFATAELILLAVPKATGAAATDTPVRVQFNPTSLRMQRQSSQLRSGMMTKDQKVQYPSSQAATLSFDLEFDTAELLTGADTGSPTPVDVRTLTAPIHQAVGPPSGKPAGAPRRVRFKWGEFEFQGVVTQLTEEFDYFATNGAPLRSKLSLTIEEQNPKQDAGKEGAGAQTDSTATQPGGAPDRQMIPSGKPDPPTGATAGRSGTDNPEREEPAQQGESMQQLAARLGGDPAAWRSLMTGQTSPLGLPGGTRVLVGPELDAPAAIGRTLGFASGAAQSPLAGLADALGLPAPGALPGGIAIPVPTTVPIAPISGPLVSGAPSPAEAAGFALAAAGGLEAAVRTVLSAGASTTVAAERAAFAVPAAPARPPAARAAGVGPETAAIDVDPRALSYGRALPLRARMYAPTAQDAQAGGRRALAARAQPVEVTVSRAPSTPPWDRLPPAADGRAVSDVAQRGRDTRASTIRRRPGGGCR